MDDLEAAIWKAMQENQVRAPSGKQTVAFVEDVVHAMLLWLERTHPDLVTRYRREMIDLTNEARPR